MIQVKANVANGKEVILTFSERQIRLWIEQELKRIEEAIKSGSKASGSRKLKQVKNQLHTTNNQNQSSTVQIESLFQPGSPWAKYVLRFKSIYCKRCSQFIDKDLTQKESHVIPKPKGHNRGGAKFTYLVCPQSHELIELSRRVS